MKRNKPMRLLAAAKVDHPNELAIDPRPKALMLFNRGVNFT